MPRAVRPEAHLLRLPCFPALAERSETTAAGNAGTVLPPPARRLAVQHGSTFLRSVVFPLPLELPSFPPVESNSWATFGRRNFLSEPVHRPPALSAFSSVPALESPRKTPRLAFGNCR